MARRAAAAAEAAVAQAAFCRPLTPKDVQAIAHMRARLEETAGPRNLKRGRGGMVDIEFLVQMLQLRHGYENPAIRAPNTLAAMAALEAAGALSAAACEYLIESYTFLRRVESRLRLLHAAARNDLPDDVTELATVARGLGLAGGETLTERCGQYLGENRRRFEAFFSSRD